MRRTTELTAVLMLGQAIAFAHAPTARAAIVSSVDAAGVLSVAGDDAGDDVDIRCSDAGEVRINRDPPGTGVALCASITAISVAAGGGPDTIDLNRVDPAEFTALTAVVLEGGDGTDGIEGSGLPDTILGQAGNDHLVASFPADVVDGGGGYDRAQLFVEGEVVITDSDIPETEVVHLSGSQGPDQLDAKGFSGTLQVDSRDGDDTIFGGSGPNDLNGGDGNDTLIGGGQSDRLQGGGGRDSGSGKGGRDVFFGFNVRADIAKGGAGNDLFHAFFGGQGLELSGGSGVDAVELSVDESVIVTDEAVRRPSGRADIHSIERAYIEAGPDEVGVSIDATVFSGPTRIRGSIGDDILLGGTSRDSIEASAGDDTLSGGVGNDELDGGDGTDMCDGGQGDDRISNCE